MWLTKYANYICTLSYWNSLRKTKWGGGVVDIFQLVEFGWFFLQAGVSCSLKLLLLAPLVLLPHLLLLAGGEVILDVESLPDLLGCLSLDHVGHCLAGNIKEPLNVKVVGCQDQLKEGSLINLQKICIPGGNVVSPLLLVLIVLREWGVILVVGGPLNHLLQDGSIHVGQGDNLLILFVHSKVFQHGLDGHRLLCNLDIHRKDLAITGLQLD